MRIFVGLVLLPVWLVTIPFSLLNMVCQRYIFGEDTY